MCSTLPAPMAASRTLSKRLPPAPAAFHPAANLQVRAPYIIKPSIGKGNGVFAARTIRPGTVIIKERSIMGHRGLPTDSHEAKLREQYNGLSAVERESFLQLADGTRPYKSPLVRKFVNNTAGVEDEYHIYLEFSRIYHSCRPNADWKIDKLGTGAQVTVISNQSIAKGEEVMIQYIPRLPFLPKEHKSVALKGNYGFACTCPVCSLPAAEQEASDRRRIELGKLHSESAHAPDIMTDVVGFDRCRSQMRAGRLMEDEGLLSGAAQCYTVAAYLGFLEMASRSSKVVVISEAQDVSLCISKAEKLYRQTVSESSPDATKLREVLSLVETWALFRAVSLYLASGREVDKDDYALLQTSTINYEMLSEQRHNDYMRQTSSSGQPSRLSRGLELLEKWFPSS